MKESYAQKFYVILSDVKLSYDEKILAVALEPNID